MTATSIIADFQLEWLSQTETIVICGEFLEDDALILDWALKRLQVLTEELKIDDKRVRASLTLMGYAIGSIDNHVNEIAVNSTRLLAGLEESSQ